MENKKVEKFFLDYLPKKEDVSKSLCCLWLTNYYIEAEGRGFSSEEFKNQDERIEAMFPGMPEDTLNLLKLKAYKHRSDQHGENHEERIKELEPMVAATEYQEFTTQVWWFS